MLDERRYLLQVDKLMDRLRAACLGQNTPLTEILPAHLKTAPPDEQAAQLAEQMLFALVGALPGKEHTLHELQRCRTWLHGTARYLLEECHGDDHTFAQWKKLLELPLGARIIIFTNFADPAAKELTAASPPHLLQNFDLAALFLLNLQGRLSIPNTMYHALTTHV